MISIGVALGQAERPTLRPTEIFAPISTPAQSIFDLSLLVMAIAAAIFIIVSGLLAYSIVKFRRRSNEDGREPPQVYGSARVELAWTITPVILLGRPGVLCAPAVRRIGRRITHPVSCWLAGTAVVVAWHVPAAHELGMSSPSWHLVQHATFLAGGLLFWCPVINPGSSSGKWDRAFAPVYLFLATLPCDALSAFLAFCGRVVYPSHHSGHPHFDLSPLQDQECAGALMWFWVTIAYLIPAVVITVRMLSPSSVGPTVRLQVDRRNSC